MARESNQVVLLSRLLTMWWSPAGAKGTTVMELPLQKNNFLTTLKQMMA
jgi:hypothetical protein